MSHQSVPSGAPVPLLEVVSEKVEVALPAGEKVEGDHEDGMSHADQSPLLAPTGGQ